MFVKATFASGVARSSIMISASPATRFPSVPSKVTAWPYMTPVHRALPVVGKVPGIVRPSDVIVANSSSLGTWGRNHAGSSLASLSETSNVASVPAKTDVEWVPSRT